MLCCAKVHNNISAKLPVAPVVLTGVSLQVQAEAPERWPDHPHAEHWNMAEVEDTLPNVRWPPAELQLYVGLGLRFRAHLRVLQHAEPLTALLPERLRCYTDLRRPTACCFDPGALAATVLLQQSTALPRSGHPQRVTRSGSPTPKQ